MAQAESLTPKLQINGFATAGGTWLTEDFDQFYLGDIDEQGSWQRDSVLGLQLSYALDDKFDLVGQLVSSGSADFQTEAEWAYVAYRLNDNLRFRAGRFAAPWFMYTESLRVGQAFPWARLPVELYNGIDINSLNGVDMLYRQPLGDWNLDAQVSLGGSRNSYLKVKNNRGLNVNLSNSSFTLHAGYSEAELGIEVAKDPSGNSGQQAAYLMNLYGVDMNQKGERATFTDLGMTFDDGSWMAAAEFGQLRLDGFANDFDAGYVSVGHYFGKWLPYVLASKINLVKVEECTAEFQPAVDNAQMLATTANTQASGLEAYAAFTGDPVDAAVAAQARAQANAAAGGAVLASQASYSLCNTSEQTSYSVGFRYDATKNVSLKMQVDHVRDFNGTQGRFQGAFPGPDESTQVITFNVNAAF
jgi:hypothetical protein